MKKTLDEMAMDIIDEELDEMADILDDGSPDDSDNADAPMNSIENVIEWINRQDTATFTISQKKFKNRIEKLAERYPDECRILHKNADGSIVAKFPLSWVRITRPVIRKLTPKQREEAIARLERYREYEKQQQGKEKDE